MKECRCTTRWLFLGFMSMCADGKKYSSIISSARALNHYKLKLQPYLMLNTMCYNIVSGDISICCCVQPVRVVLEEFQHILYCALQALLNGARHVQCTNYSALSTLKSECITRD